MDLKQLDTKTASNEGRELVIKCPASGEDTDIKITLAGPDSDLFQKMNIKLQRDLRKKLLKNRNFEFTSEEESQLDYERFARATLGWTGMQENGQEVPFSFENAKRIYREYPVIFRQVTAFLGDQANFLPRSETPSVEA